MLKVLPLPREQYVSLSRAVLALDTSRCYARDASCCFKPCAYTILDSRMMSSLYSFMPRILGLGNLPRLSASSCLPVWRYARARITCVLSIGNGPWALRLWTSIAFERHAKAVLSSSVSCSVWTIESYICDEGRIWQKTRYSFVIFRRIYARSKKVLCGSRLLFLLGISFFGDVYMLDARASIELERLYSRSSTENQLFE